MALVYLTALLGGEICRRLRIPSLLGELLGGILIGVSGLHWIVLPIATREQSVLVNWVAWLHGTTDSEIINQVFQFQGDFFQSLAAVGITVLLFEIGLGSTLNQLLLNRSQAIA
ncbi:MAG: cation:proton antiporter, partial [Synechococcaceae cyanobacterium SM2_3_60]|nr:cation:proton antiporter [Synechococcaceae cyanobacterium SM2_3_60]